MLHLRLSFCMNIFWMHQINQFFFVAIHLAYLIRNILFLWLVLWCRCWKAASRRRRQMSTRWVSFCGNCGLARTPSPECLPFRWRCFAFSHALKVALEIRLSPALNHLFPITTMIIINFVSSISSHLPPLTGCGQGADGGCASHHPCLRSPIVDRPHPAVLARQARRATHPAAGAAAPGRDPTAGAAQNHGNLIFSASMDENVSHWLECW